jgi:YidC/Oxa1 family membrane protein insertase
MGPKDNHMLRQMGEKWGNIMNYGWFSPISRLLNWVLHIIHDGIAKISHTWSWGISIVLLTLVVRISIWPLYNKSNRSMKRMSKLKPEMDKIKEKYPNDPNRVNQEVMKLYKKYGVNPIGGCLPMLLQIPIFFGFYRMLQYAVELRHEPFLWWVNDLSQPDTVGHFLGFPINLLPIVMTLTSFAQMAMMPKTGDKMQQRLMMFMPFMFLIFCYSFASALALYWTTQNIFTIFQTWITSKLPEPQLKEKEEDPNKPKKKSFMERMIEKQEEMQRAQAARGHGDASKLRDVTPGKKRPPKTGG